MVGGWIFFACAVLVVLVALRVTDRMNQSTLEPTGPDAQWGRWRISYMDSGGVITKRVIRILEVKPNLRMVQAWCELRQNEQTFLLDSILEAVDPANSQPINVEDWLKNYSSMRRNGQ